MPLYKLARGRIVVDDQDQRLIALRHCAEDLRMVLHYERLIEFCDARQSNREGRSPTRLALDRNVATHHLTKAAADRESKTCAAVLPGRAGGSLRRLLKDLADLFLRHADPSVGYGDHDPVPAIQLLQLRGDGDRALFGKLVGVARQIK